MFKHVKLNESVLPKSLGVKGKNQDGIRYYTIDGVNMPSVTSILGDIPERKEKIIQWRKAVGEQMANYISVTSTNRGKSTHKLIENHLNNEDDKSNGVTNVVALGLFRLIKPYLKRIDNIHCLEEYLYSKEIGVAGQVDCVAEYKGKLSIIDFKTSTKRRDADYNYGNFLQCSAYAKMFEEMYPDKKIEQTVVLATCESGEVQEWLHTEDKIKEHQELFYKHTQEFLDRHKESLVEITK
jgi:genome maintenance exonuclease 1